MISPEQFSEFFNKGAKRMNREVLHYRIEAAEPQWPSDADLKAVGEACDRWLAERRRLTALKIPQKKTVDTPHTSAYNSPQL